MNPDRDKSRANATRAEVSRRLRAYYTSLSLILEDGAAELLDRVERRAASGGPELSTERDRPLR